MSVVEDGLRDKAPTWDEVDWRPAFDSERSALLVIDPQNDILDPRGNMSFRAVYQYTDSTVPNIIALMEAAHKADRPVFVFRYNRLVNGGDVFDGTLIQARIKAYRRIASDMYDAGTWDSDIYDDVKNVMRESDYLIDKSSAGCFEGTYLDKYLRGLGVKDLVVTGYLTDFCVASTARQAYDKDYGVVLVEDACATGDVALHDQTMGMHRKNFGPVVSTSEATGLLLGQ